MVPSELRGTVQVIGPLPARRTSMRVPAWTVTVRPLSFSVSTIVLGGGGQGRTTIAEGPEGLVEAALHGGGGQGRAIAGSDEPFMA
jgi:hypothetical protein